VKVISLILRRTMPKY